QFGESHLSLPPPALYRGSLHLGTSHRSLPPGVVPPGKASGNLGSTAGRHPLHHAA
ncbi:MAG: hypothetical protein BJ554DRAFT_1609, partial [Olpidium bornovanus]